MTSFGDLLGPPPVRLEIDPEPAGLLEDGTDPAQVAADYPTSSLAWAYLAEKALANQDADGSTVAAYAYARTGYHRGLDQLRRQGWKGFGPVPFDHEPNQGFLRCVAALAKAANAIGEEEEYLRCLDLLNESDPHSASQLGLAD